MPLRGIEPRTPGPQPGILSTRLKGQLVCETSEFFIRIASSPVRMGRKKVYGESRVSQCPYCGKDAYSKNPQGIPVCNDHKNQATPDLRCMCKGYLDIRESKFGVFFTCMDCGAVSWSKMMEINSEKFTNAKFTRTEREPSKPRSKSPFILDTIRMKIKNGEPLTQEELEFL